LHECIGYERREEGAALSPAETLRLGRGACRDVTVLLAEILRQMDSRRASRAVICAKATRRRGARKVRCMRGRKFSCRAQDGLVSTRPMVFFCNHNFIGAAVGLTAADITPISGIYFHKKRIPAQMTSRLQLINL